MARKSALGYSAEKKRRKPRKGDERERIYWRRGGKKRLVPPSTLGNTSLSLSACPPSPVLQKESSRRLDREDGGRVECARGDKVEGRCLHVAKRGSLLGPRPRVPSCRRAHRKESFQNRVHKKGKRAHLPQGKEGLTGIKKKGGILGSPASARCLDQRILVSTRRKEQGKGASEGCDRHLFRRLSSRREERE